MLSFKNHREYGIWSMIRKKPRGRHTKRDGSRAAALSKGVVAVLLLLLLLLLWSDRPLVML